MIKIKKNRKTIFIITAVISIILLFITFSEEEVKTGEIKKEKVSIPVTVLEVEPDSYRANLSLFGELLPEWQTVIRNQVNGQIVSFSPRFRVGEIVEKNEELIGIEDHQLRVNLAEAELRLNQAEINLVDEKASQRALFLEAAKKEVEAAEKQLKLTKIELEKSVIRAPYKGLIVERYVNEGDLLFEGNEVALIYGTDKSQVSVSMNARQWNFLPENFADIEVSLIDAESNNKWKASVSRDGKRLKRESRLRPLFLEIENPLALDPPLLSGTFLNVQLKGRYIENLLKIPESAYTKSGYIWYINNNKLKSLKTDPVFRENNEIYINNSIKMPSPVLIANSPNSSFIDGRNVSVLIEKEGE